MTGARAEHAQPNLDSITYRLDSLEGSAVFTGDTEPCRSVVEMAAGADAMPCMCWDDQEEMDRNGEAPRQCGTTGATRMAQEAGVGKLVLVHIGPKLSSHRPMQKDLRDICRIYDGEVIFSEQVWALDI